MNTESSHKQRHVLDRNSKLGMKLRLVIIRQEVRKIWNEDGSTGHWDYGSRIRDEVEATGRKRMASVIGLS